MSEIRTDVRINKKGKIVKNRSNTAIVVFSVVVGLIILWIVFILFFSKYAESYLKPYTTTKNEYDTATTLLNITASLWGALISGIATGSIAFLTLWRQVKTNKIGEKLYRSSSVKPDLKIELKIHKKTEDPDEYRDWAATSPNFIRLKPEISEEAINYLNSNDRVLAYVNKLNSRATRPDDNMGKCEDNEDLTDEDLKTSHEIISDMEYLENHGVADKKSNAPLITSDNAALPMKNCMNFAKDLGYNPDNDLWLTLTIRNTGFGSAQLKSLICNGSGQPWNYNQLISASNNGEHHIEAIVSKEYFRQIRFSIEFTDILGVRFYQGYMFQLSNLLAYENEIEYGYYTEWKLDEAYPVMMMEQGNV